MEIDAPVDRTWRVGTFTNCDGSKGFCFFINFKLEKTMGIDLQILILSIGLTWLSYTGFLLPATISDPN